MKKHAVNTLSSTQVRKGVYTDSLKAWMRYEDQLGPLLKLVGDRVEFDMKTTLPTYHPPTAQDVSVTDKPGNTAFESEDDMTTLPTVRVEGDRTTMPDDRNPDGTEEQVTDEAPSVSNVEHTIMDDESEEL